ncbi:hypothetical protein [Clostridium botulinum]|uniref:hypothetical protein n=1 Tax=Clostridium botulinum TaxID=1491 RepID=UPI00090B8253|nr:hypothetical protein [Clostridium botulinum]APH21808.1 hypothetical protein NPD1_2878 [Clostridium botulinum]APQ67750.1 hypothetical protein RSJ8_1004 [Clostridium botulinum]
MKIICINNKASIPELELKKKYKIIKETARSYYIETKFGILPYAKIRFLKII